MNSIFKKKEAYYLLANEKLRTLDVDEIDLKSIIVKEKSIQYIIDHIMIPNDSIGITLNLFLEDPISPIGYYTLYIDLEMEFVDEFFVLHR